MPIDLGNAPTGTSPSPSEKLQIRTALGIGVSDAVTFDSLSASTSLTLPSTTGTAAGHMYSSTNTIRYRDTTNTERLLLNNADNLGNLASLSAARTNIGLGTTDSPTFSAITLKGSLSAGGNFLFGPDNTYDIGGASSNRPKAINCVGQITTQGAIQAGNTLAFGGTSVVLRDAGPTAFYVTNNANTVGVGLSATTDGWAKFRQRNNAGHAFVQGKLTTDTAFQAGTVVPTGFLVLYDSNGTAYNVPAVPV